MKRYIDLCKIMYKIVDVSEDEVPILVVENNKSCTAYYKDKAQGKRYLLINPSSELEVKDVLELANACYLAYYDKNFGLPEKKENDDMKTIRIFKKKYYRDSVNFSHLILVNVLKVLSKASEDSKYDEAIKAFSQIVDVNDYEINVEEKNEIQTLLNESFKEVNNIWENKIVSFNEEILQWFIKY